MNTKRLIEPWKLLFATLVMFPIVAFYTITNYYVTINNRSDSRIQNITLDYSGGTKKVSAMNSGDSRWFIVRPSTASTMILHFTDSAGLNHTKDLDLYTEPLWGGKIEVFILPNGTIDVKR
jgi:hypothetical protein